MNKVWMDRICGIERTKESPAFGELVVLTAFLWSKIGGPVVGAKLTGAVAHDGEVIVTNVFDDEKFGKWCRVETDIWHKGKMYHQQGWLTAKLLKEEGA